MEPTQPAIYVLLGALPLHWLSLCLRGQESKEVSKIHGRMSKDLARAADRSSNPAACPFALVVKALSKRDSEGTGFVKVESVPRWAEWRMPWAMLPLLYLCASHLGSFCLEGDRVTRKGFLVRHLLLHPVCCTLFE